MLIGIVFFGEDKMLITRTKIAYQRGLPIAGIVYHFSAGLMGNESQWILFKVWELVTTIKWHARLASTIYLGIRSLFLLLVEGVCAQSSCLNNVFVLTSSFLVQVVKQWFVELQTTS